jgi:hypothetical protein
MTRREALKPGEPSFLAMGWDGMGWDGMADGGMGDKCSRCYPADNSPARVQLLVALGRLGRGEATLQAGAVGSTVYLLTRGRAFPTEIGNDGGVGLGPRADVVAPFATRQHTLCPALPLPPTAIEARSCTYRPCSQTAYYRR